MTSPAALAVVVAAAEVGPGQHVLEIGPGTGNLTRLLVSSGARVTAVEKDASLVPKLEAAFAGCRALAIVGADFLEWRLAEFCAAAAAGLARESVVGVRDSTVGVSDATVARVRDPSGGVHGPPWLNGVALGHGGDSVGSGEGAGREGGGAGDGSALPRRVKVVANLPFNITAEALARLLPLGEHVGAIYLLLQEDAARRLATSAPNDKDYRAASVRLNFYGRPRYALSVPRSAFFPEPHVDAGLLELVLHRPAELPVLRGGGGGAGQGAARAAFCRVVDMAFASRRKMIKNNLLAEHDASVVEAALVAAGLSPSARPQELSAADFVAFFNALPEPTSTGRERS